MERIDSLEKLGQYAPSPATYEGRRFLRDLLAYYAATQLFEATPARTAAFLPQLKDVATFEEYAEDDAEAGVINLYLGLVRNGKAGLVPIEKRVVEELCRPAEKVEKTGAPF